MQREVKKETPLRYGLGSLVVEKLFVSMGLHWGVVQSCWKQRRTRDKKLYFENLKLVSYTTLPTQNIVIMFNLMLCLVEKVYMGPCLFMM